MFLRVCVKLYGLLCSRVCPPVHVGVGLLCDAVLIPVDAVISEDVTVFVSPLRDGNMFRDAATAACHLFYRR